MLLLSTRIKPILISSGSIGCLLKSLNHFKNPNNFLSTSQRLSNQPKLSNSCGGHINTSAMSVDLSKLGGNRVKLVPSMEEVKLETLWAENTVVITFLRRFGCLFCRQAAKELSTLTPILAAHNVKNVGVGLEELGLEEFVEGKFFNGDLYVDVEKKTFKDIGFKRWGIMSMISGMLAKTSRDALSQNKTENLPSNLKGDGYQSGGTLIITKGGSQVLLDYRQVNPADHVDNADVLRVLGIPVPETEAAN